MCNSILAHGIDMAFLDLEPFSKREALNWLMNKANEAISDKKINLSIRHIARIWNWHKSKVERFIITLKKKAVIETTNEEGKTRINICNLMHLQKNKCDTETITETVIETKADLGGLKAVERDTSETGVNLFETQQLPGSQQTYLDNAETAIETALRFDTVKTQERDTFDVLSIGHQTLEFPDMQQIPPDKAETDSRQKRDSFEIKKKKEKKQKKEKEESIKEKNISYRDIKKEKVCEGIDSFPSIHSHEVIDFAASIAIAPHEVEWEIAKFKDHLKCSDKKLPKDIMAAFRNWLRRSLEFNRFKGRNGQINQTAPTSFERFLAGAARAVAERQRHRLAGGYAREESILKPESTCDKQEFRYLQPVN